MQKDQKPHIQEVFKLLEDAVAGAEKTISRALTNGTLGLGAIGVGNAGEGPVKGSLGVGERSMKFGSGRREKVASRVVKAPAAKDRSSGGLVKVKDRSRVDKDPVVRGLSRGCSVR